MNTFITVDREGTMKAARAADPAVERGDALGALHDVPVSIIINTAGMRTTGPALAGGFFV